MLTQSVERRTLSRDLFLYNSKLPYRFVARAEVFLQKIKHKPPKCVQNESLSDEREEIPHRFCSSRRRFRLCCLLLCENYSKK